jgi:hypothetical protein
MTRPALSSLSLVVLAALLVCLTWGHAVHAEEPVAIGRIIADPEPYHLRQVTLRGTVRQVHQLEPYFQPSGTACHSAYVFALEDETGALEVMVLGLCGSGAANRPPDVSAGNRVIVRATLQAPGHLGTFYGLDGRPLHGLNPQALHAIAGDIVHIAQ